MGRISGRQLISISKQELPNIRQVRKRYPGAAYIWGNSYNWLIYAVEKPLSGWAGRQKRKKAKRRARAAKQPSGNNPGEAD